MEGWVNKKEKTTSKTATKFTESFDVTMVETMNNKDCRCFGEFFDADLKSYEISSPLTRVFAYGRFNNNFTVLASTTVDVYIPLTHFSFFHYNSSEVIQQVYVLVFQTF